MPEYHQVAGDAVSCDDLTLPRARDFAVLVRDGASPHVALVSCHRLANGTELVACDVRPTVPQRPRVAIAKTERILVGFRVDDGWYPDVRALRVDFPRACVLHLNLVPATEPASLCLFVQSWKDIRLRLTANELLHRVQTWLNDTADGSLHREDQPLEPFFLTGPAQTPVIVSGGLTDAIFKGASSLELGIARHGEDFVFIQTRLDAVRRVDRQLAPALVVPLISKPHEHCILYSTPGNFAELGSQLEAIGIDLLGSVQTELLKHQHAGTLKRFGFLVLLLLFRRQRSADSEPESELAAFFCHGNPKEGLQGVARELGLSGTGDVTKRGEDLNVHHMAIRYELSPARAAAYSGVEALDIPLVGIGAGAIGSQVILQSAQGGLARWTVVDNDILLPHNLVRHGLRADWLGAPKAAGVAFEVNNMFEAPTATGIVADFQDTGGETAALAQALASAAAVVDMSASVSVARDLARDETFAARRCSMFCSPSGRDFVFLGESGSRTLRLDQLEAQYFRAVASDDRLAEHLAGGSTIGSCRDITSRVPQSLMGLHAATGVRALRTWLEQDSATVRLVCANDQDLALSDVRLELGEAVVAGNLGGWSVQTDSQFLDEVREQRRRSLPNETGGVLLAQVDVQRRVLYVCHHIPAPPDSQRQPTMYIRGSEGLKQAYDEILRRTQNNLVYVGEWHSHPDRCACSPSMDDIVAGAWLAEKTREGSLPGIMLIVGDREQTCWMLCSRDDARSPAELEFVRLRGTVVQ